jgi:hypothetical protein
MSMNKILLATVPYFTKIICLRLKNHSSFLEKSRRLFSIPCIYRQVPSLTEKLLSDRCSYIHYSLYSIFHRLTKESMRFHAPVLFQLFLQHSNLLFHHNILHRDYNLYNKCFLYDNGFF